MNLPLTLSGHGFRRARRHLATVLLLYLASLLPALMVVSLISADLGPSLDRSLFADRLMTGDGFGVWTDFQRSDAGNQQAIFSVMLNRFLLATLLQMLVAAGLVEVLLDRAAAGERPFLSGIGRHGFRFVRSGLTFVVMLAIAVALSVPLRMAFRNGSDRLALIGMLVQLLVIFLLYCVLRLAYDFSRVSAAAHGEGRMLVGFFKALGFVFRHLMVVLPLFLLFTVLMVALHLGLVAIRARWAVDTPGDVLGWLLAQQAVFFAIAFLRTALWGAEVTYFQGIGEPRWCGRRRPAPPVAPTPRPTPRPVVRPAPEPSDRAPEPMPPVSAAQPTRTEQDEPQPRPEPGEPAQPETLRLTPRELGPQPEPAQDPTGGRAAEPEENEEE